MDYTQNLHLAVLTTSNVLKEKSPIVYISHDDEGKWTFLSAENVSVTDAMLVDLKDIIEHDGTVIKVLDMPINHEAYRKDKDSEWIIIARN